MQSVVETGYRQFARLVAAADQLARAGAGARDGEAERQRLEAEVEAKRSRATALLEEIHQVHRGVTADLDALGLAPLGHTKGRAGATRDASPPSLHDLTKLESCLVTARDTATHLQDAMSSLSTLRSSQKKEARLAILISGSIAGFLALAALTTPGAAVMLGLLFVLGWWIYNRCQVL